ncbi:hypothetical protein Plhal304r1_c006g0024301 [Plasmopara halstedii]
MDGESIVSGSAAVLSKVIIDGMRQRGCEYAQYGSRREPLHGITMTLGDDAHLFYKSSCLSENGNNDSPPSLTDPLIHIVPPNPGDGVVPQPIDLGPIILEAQSILIAYQNLLTPAFAIGLPPPMLPGPGGIFPSLGLFYHHSTIAAHAIGERISHPGPGVCPTINAQPNGTILCALHIGYANAMVAINIPRH